jgi:VanZ family protein
MKLFFTHWLPWILYAGLIFYVSSQQLPEVPVKLPDIDKAAHVVEYGLFALLAFRALSTINNKPIRRHFIFVVLIISVLYAFSDEWHQLYVPGRQMDPLDFLYDSLGAIIVSILLKINDLRLNSGKICKRS